MSKRLNVAIAGAGIGGLALAALLARAGHPVTLFDQFDKPRPVGSGLMIQPIGLAVLDRCGAGAAARRAGQRISRMLGHEADRGQRILDVTYTSDDQPEAQGLAIHRASLHLALLQAAEAQGVAVTPGAMVTAAPVLSDKRYLELEEGAQYGPYDLIVDASGASSLLSPLRARALPYGAVWGTVPWVKASPLPTNQLSQRYRRASHMAGVLPVGSLPGKSGLHAAVFWSLPVRNMAAWQAQPLGDWKAEAVALWPEFEPFLADITRHDQMTPASYTHGTLRRPYAPGLAFIGDAAHRASPQLGQGANMALLDALALSLALDREALDEALPLYARMRRWHVRLYQGMSAAFTPQYQSDSRTLPALRDWFLAPVSLTPPLPRVLSRLVAGQLIPPLAGVNFP